MIAARNGTTSAVSPPAVDRAVDRVHHGIATAAAQLGSLGVPVPDFRGRLLRPLVAYAVAPGVADSGEHDARFWAAVLAVQLAHEASLLHDDVIDGAEVRRGVPSVVARSGIAGALIQGDHLLTASYRAAVQTQSLPFIALFARAVERTVAGERLQAEMPADIAASGGWREIVLGKSGELFGCALAAGELCRGADDAAPMFELGRRIGMLYQMVDDLLDYCPHAPTGKVPLADYRANRWTWPLGCVPELTPGLGEGEVLKLVFGGAHSPGRQMLARLEDEADLVTRDVVRLVGPCATLQVLIEEWRMRARDAVRGEESALAVTLQRPNITATVRGRDDGRPPLPSEWASYLGRHGRSFRYATTFMPPGDRDQVAAVYAWCRYTDDLVDHADADGTDLRLDDWLAASRAAHDGVVTGIPLLDDVMGRTRDAGVPFTYAGELIAGMRMDLRHRPYATLAELGLYTWRAAGTVGLWMAELYGVREQWATKRAAALGQAMQLTNILRDVGEDLSRGRLYLPLDRLAAHGLSPERLVAARANGEPLGDGWPSLLEELMALAERDYERAAEAFPELPPGFRRAATVASAVYAGIHDAIRRIGYDTLNRRAVTTKRDKVVLSARALLGLGTIRLPVEPQLEQLAR